VANLKPKGSRVLTLLIFEFVCLFRYLIHKTPLPLKVIRKCHVVQNPMDSYGLLLYRLNPYRTDPCHPNKWMTVTNGNRFTLWRYIRSRVAMLKFATREACSLPNYLAEKTALQIGLVINPIRCRISPPIDQITSYVRTKTSAEPSLVITDGRNCSGPNLPRTRWRLRLLGVSIFWRYMHSIRRF
jgi:hypothetical protein